MAKTEQKAADFIVPLDINGLQGRMLRLPPPSNKNREILFVYGHHSSLERWWGVLQDLNQYGAVTAPDLPGFGGMDSFYKIGKPATVDNLADYLATFIKLRYKRKKVTIAGMSFGFVIVTRMLQRYPDLAKKVDLLVSIVGFTHHDDFKFSRRRIKTYELVARFFSQNIPSRTYRGIFRPTVIRLAYVHSRFAKEKFASPERADRKRFMEFEIGLWRDNDMRTHWKTIVEFLTLDNCKQSIKLPIWNVVIGSDRYFDRHTVEQHMRIVFSDYKEVFSKLEHHAPSVIADKKAASVLIPYKLRQMLAQEP